MGSTLALVLSALRLAGRRLLRVPAFSLTVALTLALGIGVTTAMFALVYAILVRPLPYRDAERLAMIRHEASRVELPMTGISPGLADHYRAGSRTLDALGVYVERVATLSDRGEPRRVRVASVTPELLSILRPGATTGRALAAGDYAAGAESRAFISHALWVQRYGADPALVGRTIEIDRVTYRVVGVAERAFHFPGPDTEVWIAWGWPPEAASRAALRGLAFGAVARLRPGVTVADAERDLARLVGALPDVFSEVTAETIARMGLRARAIPLKEAVVGDLRLALLLLQASAGLLLVITWANVGNITLVRGERLRRDIAMSRALGATGRFVAARFVGEALVLATIGGALGLALAAAAVEMRFGLPLDGIPRLAEVGVDAAVVGVALALSAASAALLAGVALVSARRGEVLGALTGGSVRLTAGRREHAVRQMLVGGQVALALTLLIGSALMARSFWELRQVRLGFAPDGALTFRLPLPPGEYSSYHASARLHAEMLHRVRALPGVTAVEAAHASTFPVTAVPVGYQFRLMPADHAIPDRDAAPWGRLGFATPGYFEAMGIPILKGRTFRPGDTGRDAHGIILSAALARALFADEEPVGRRLRWVRTAPSPEYVVVGVVGDVPGERLADGPSQAFYFPNVYPPLADTVTGVVHDYIPFDEVYVVRTQLPAAALLPAIHRVAREIDPKLVVTRTATLRELVSESLAQTRLTLLLLLVGAASAVLLGVIGIYGMLSYTLSLRSSELGIRLALGATPQGIAWMLVRQGAVQAGAGIAVGLLAAVALGRYLRSLLYEVSPTDPLAFGAMATLLFAIAMVASYVPARRAARSDPTDALRNR